MNSFKYLPRPFFRSLLYAMAAFLAVPTVMLAQDPIEVIEDQGEGVVTLYGKNNFEMDCEVMIDIESFGLDYSKPEPFTMLIPGGKTVKLVVLTPQPGKAWKYSFNVKYRQISPDENPAKPQPPATEPVTKAPDQNSWPYTEYGPPDDVRESNGQGKDIAEEKEVYTPPVDVSPPVVEAPPVKYPENTPPQHPNQTEQQGAEKPGNQTSSPASDPDSDYLPYSDYGPPVYPDENVVTPDAPTKEDRELEERFPNDPGSTDPEIGSHTQAPTENNTEGNLARESMPDAPPVRESKEDSYRPASAVSIRPASPFAREKAELKGIMLYTEPGCRRCDQAREALKQLDVKFKETSLSQNSIAITGLWEQLKTFGFPGGPINTPVVSYGTELFHDIDDIPAFLSDLVSGE